MSSEPDSAPVRSPWGAIETIVGVVGILLGSFAWLANAFRGWIAAGAVAAIVVIAWLLFVSGARRRWTPRRRAGARRIGAPLLFVVLTASGPTASSAYLRHEERRMFDELDDPDIDLEQWLTEYTKLDKSFRREGYKDAWMLARIAHARRTGDEATLQAIAAEIDRDTATEYPGAKASLAEAAPPTRPRAGTAAASPDRGR